MAASCKGALMFPPCNWAKTPSRHLHTPEERGDHPARRAFQSTPLVATMRTRWALVFPLPDGLFQGGSHRLPPCCLNLLFHFRETGACRQLDCERYLYLHAGVLLL